MHDNLFILLPFQQVQLNYRMNHISNHNAKAKHQIALEMYQYHKDVKNCLEKLLKDGKITLEEFRKLLITFSNLENYISEKDEYVKQEVASMGDKDYICWSDRIELKAKAENILELLEDLGEIPESTKDKVMKETDFDTLKKWLKLAAKTESLAAFEEEIEKIK